MAGITWRKTQMFLLLWFARLMVQLKNVWEHLVFWAGLYFPLFIVNMIIGAHKDRTLTVENDDFEKFQLEFFRIEYQIPYSSGNVKTKLRYNVTSRVLWLLNYVGDNYGDCTDFVLRSLPWGDMHRHKFKNEDAEIVFNYHVAKFGEGKVLHPINTVRLQVKFNDIFLWNTFEQVSKFKNTWVIDGPPKKPPPVHDIRFSTIRFLEPEVNSDDE
jgi:hypothetical protein